MPLAIEHAKRLGKTRLITSVWAHNLPSRKVLEKAGFVENGEWKGDGVGEEVLYLKYLH